MKSKTISRLPGVASEGTRAVFVLLVVPNPVPKHGATYIENVQCLSPPQKNQFTPLFASLCFLSLPRASRQIGRPIMANAELLV